MYEKDSIILQAISSQILWYYTEFCLLKVYTNNTKHVRRENILIYFYWHAHALFSERSFFSTLFLGK